MIVDETAIVDGSARGVFLREQAAAGATDVRIDLANRATDRGWLPLRDADLVAIEAAIEDAARAGFDVVVALHAPSLAGHDPWLDLDAPERFGEWVDHVVTRLADACNQWITTVDANGFALRAYARGRSARTRPLATGHLIRHLDNSLAGHAVAAGRIRDTHRGSTVGIANRVSYAYEIDALLVDLLLHGARGIAARDLHDHLVSRRSAWNLNVPVRGVAARAFRRAAASAIPLEQAFPRAQAAIREVGDRPLDCLHSTWSDGPPPPWFARASHVYGVPVHAVGDGRWSSGPGFAGAWTRDRS